MISIIQTQMLLGTITPRIQSRAAAGEMAEQAQLVACPALLSRRGRATKPKRVGLCPAEVALPSSARAWLCSGADRDGTAWHCPGAALLLPEATWEPLGALPSPVLGISVSPKCAIHPMAEKGTTLWSHFGPWKMDPAAPQARCLLCPSLLAPLAASPGQERE